MKVGIDGRIFLKPGSGTVRYAYDLMGALLKTDKKNAYVIYVPGNGEEIGRIKFKGNYTVRVVKGMPPILWRTPLFTRVLDNDGIDVYHSMAYIVPFVPSSMRKVRIVSSFQGLHSEYFLRPLKETIYWVFNYRMSARFADRIAAVSKTLAGEIHKKYRVPYNRIDVVMTGVSDDFQFVSEKTRAAKRDYICKKYGLGKKGYIVYIGAGMAPNKNVDTILQAMRLLREKYNFQLPIAMTRVDMAKLAPRIEQLGLKPNVDIIGLKWMDEGDINLLYACAEMTVYGSIYEGFGTVIVESQAIGTPVIASNVSAMPEAAGGAALLVDNPDEPEGWAAAVIRLHKNKTLQAALVKRGLENVKKFRYDVIARSTQKSYEAAVRHRR